MIIKSIEKACEEDKKEPNDECSKYAGRVYSLGWWVGEDSAWQDVVEIRKPYIRFRYSEVDFAVGDEFPDILLESIVANDYF